MLFYVLPLTPCRAIAPITGKLRKRFWLDVGCAFGLSISAAYAYWCVIHVLLTSSMTLIFFTGMVSTSKLVFTFR